MFKIKELYQLRRALDECNHFYIDVNLTILRNKLSDLITLQKAWNKHKRIEIETPIDDYQ